MKARTGITAIMALWASGIASYNHPESGIFDATTPAWGQAAPVAADPSGNAWRPVGVAAGSTATPPAAGATPNGGTPAATPPSAAAAAAPRGPTTFAPGTAAPGAAAPGTAPAPLDPLKRPGMKVTAGSGTLPNEAGQIWREYDISPYTSRVTSTKRPEQAIVDWIFRETGYEAWHSEPLGILSATPRALRVYHTPQMQAVVAGLVERFLISDADSRTFSLRVATIENPNWRAQAQRFLRPVPVQTPGVNAWLLQKEDAAVLLANVQRRTDYREHSSPHLLVANGQATVVSAMRSRPYVRDVLPRDVWPGFESQPGQVDEGFSLEFSPLLAIDRRTIDAVIKCDIEQVEKLVPVVVEVSSQVAARQRAKIEVPQMTHFRFHERFRWPADQVLLVGMGMVAVPVPVDGKGQVPGLGLQLPTSPPRADLLVMVESKGPTADVPSAARAATPPTPDPQRYRRPF
jgi:hypothetical protein